MMFNIEKKKIVIKMKVEMRKGWFLACECPYLAELLAKVGKSLAYLQSLLIFFTNKSIQ